MFKLITGIPGPYSFGCASTAEQVTQGIDATALTVIIIGGASGIELETSRVLAQRKCSCDYWWKKHEVCNEAKLLILKDNNNNARINILKLNLATLKLCQGIC